MEKPAVSGLASLLHILSNDDVNAARREDTKEANYVFSAQRQ